MNKVALAHGLDFKDLLTRYMEHVLDMDGTCFVPTTQCGFSSREVKFLEGLEKHCRQKQERARVWTVKTIVSHPSFPSYLTKDGIEHLFDGRSSIDIVEMCDLSIPFDFKIQLLAKCPELIRREVMEDMAARHGGCVTEANGWVSGSFGEDDLLEMSDVCMAKGAFLTSRWGRALELARLEGLSQLGDFRKAASNEGPCGGNRSGVEGVASGVEKTP